jgi:hypothetical protein
MSDACQQTPKGSIITSRNTPKSTLVHVHFEIAVAKLAHPHTGILQKLGKSPPVTQHPQVFGNIMVFDARARIVLVKHKQLRFVGDQVKYYLTSVILTCGWQYLRNGANGVGI